MHQLESQDPKDSILALINVVSFQGNSWKSKKSFIRSSKQERCQTILSLVPLKSHKRALSSKVSHCLIDIDFLEFNLTKQFPERRSAPPPVKMQKLHAREMPDFSKFRAKQIESQRDLTVPEGFELESEKRRK